MQLIREFCLVRVDQGGRRRPHRPQFMLREGKRVEVVECFETEIANIGETDLHTGVGVEHSLNTTSAQYWRLVGGDWKSYRW
jgi:hypothetical protein